MSYFFFILFNYSFFRGGGERERERETGFLILCTLLDFSIKFPMVQWDNLLWTFAPFFLTLYYFKSTFRVHTERVSCQMFNLLLHVVFFFLSFLFMCYGYLVFVNRVEFSSNWNVKESMQENFFYCLIKRLH